MFAATVRRAPDAVAIHYRDSALTFAELDERSGAFAARLAQRGVARGDRVALYLQNVPEFVVAALAAWKLGAIAVSVNPMLKEREVRTLLDDCEPVALVTLESLWEQVARAAVADTSVRVVVTEGRSSSWRASTPGRRRRIRTWAPTTSPS
jgi:long-chain acyl-CoA synthetase